ncbi:low molecular weight protein-tyrosine-phosphatase [Alistipes shahii]|jgi:protein-tyrosine phosphatase|uniref:low molecular weight protein-tyrosine-phosphatase n=1 Tax=Alistipes shahii TaxID=328814 RepID=UPI0034A169EB
MKTRILFVCLGNICRSPAAEGIMRRIVERRGLSGTFGIDSAGTYGGHRGELPDPRMRSAASRRGYALTHRSRQVGEEDFDRFDMIVAMDDMNYESLNRLAPSREAARKIFRMAEFCRRHPDRTYVPDPYYEGHEGFELVLDMLEDGCEGILEYLSENGK